MKTNTFHFGPVTVAIIAAFALSAGIAFPAVASNDAVDAFPANQVGVRAAAAQGPEALRRYIWRTRAIYNFQYQDFAPRA